MSVWSSLPHIGWDEVEGFRGGAVYGYGDGRYPHPARLLGCVDLAHIPAWCVPGHGDADESDECDMVGPWLRLSITTRDENADAELDENAARALRDDLSAWLARGKVQPR